MKKSAAFVLLVLFSGILLAGYTGSIGRGPSHRALQITGQAGMAVSILLFLLLPGKKTRHKA